MGRSHLLCSAPGRQELLPSTLVEATEQRAFRMEKGSGHEGLVNHWSAVRRRDSGDGPGAPQVTPRGSLELTIDKAEAYTYGRARRITRRTYRRGYRYARRSYRRAAYYGAASYYGSGPSVGYGGYGYGRPSYGYGGYGYGGPSYGYGGYGYGGPSYGYGGYGYGGPGIGFSIGIGRGY